MFSKKFITVFIIVVSCFLSVGSVEALDDYYGDFESKTADEYFQSANEKIDNRKFADALDDLDNAIQQDATNMDYFIKRAYAKEKLGNYTSARSDLDIVLEVHPNDVSVLKQQADVAVLRGDIDLSNECWKKVIELDNGYDAYVSRAEYFMNLKEYNAAVSDLELARDLAKSKYNEMGFGGDADDFKESVLNKIEKFLDDVEFKKIQSIQ